MVKRVLYFYFITLSFSSLGWASVQLPTPELTLSGAIDIRLSFLTDEANKNREIETRRTSSFRALKQNLVDSLSEAGSVGNTVMRVNEESPPVYIPMTEYILKRWPEVVAKNKDLFNELELKDIEQEWNDTKVPSAERVAKTLPFIGTDRGFRILNEMGDYYLERGDLGEASRVFHFLKNASVPQSISPAERKKVLQKIEYISQQSEDISSSDIEELSHLKEEIVSGAQKAAELISSCPELKAQFSSKDLIPLSPPLAVRDRIYIVMKDQHQGLYLMTLDRKTKKLLQKQLIGSKEGSWLYPFQDILPYKLLLEQGKIILLTEAGLHEFSLNGTLFKVTDLSDRKQREDTEERRRSQNIFTQYMIKTYGEDYEALAPQFSIDHDLSIARKGYLALPKKEVFPWILEKVREGYDYDIYFDLLDQAGGIPEEQLIEMMKDSNEEVFSFIQRHIAKKGSESVPFLTSLLESKDKDLKIGAIHILGGIKDSRVIPVLLPLLDDPDLSVQGAAVSALGELKAEEAKPKLRQLAQNQSEDSASQVVREAALRVLIGIKDQDSIPLFLKLTQDENQRMRMLGFYALGVVKAKESIQKLMDVVKNRKEAPDVQMAAIIALGEMEDSTAGPVLMEALSNQEAWISGRILESLGETHYESAIPKLKEVLKDSTKSRDMRESAAEGLVAMGTPEAFSALLEGYEAEKENRNIRSDIQSAIGYLKSESLIPMLSDVLRDKSQSPELKSAITAALFRMGTPAALNGVTEAFFVEDPGFRRIVFNRSMYKDEEFKENREKLVPKVVNMIKDAGLPKPAKETAIQFLEKMRVNTPEGINALIGALDDNGREVRIQAAYALGNLRAESAIPALAKHLSDGAMNEAVEFALYKIGDPGVKTLIAARKKELEDKAIAQEQKINIMASLVKTEENDAIQSVIERQDPVLMTSNGLQKVFSGVQNQIAIRYLTSIATDPHQALHMPRYAGYALRESKNSVVVQQELTKKLRDPNPQVQTLAIETIEYLHLFEAIPKLHHVLKNPSSDKEVREKSALAVVNISRDSRENVPFSVVSDVAPVLQNVIVEGISENKDKSISISGQSVVDATRFFIDFKEEESVQKILNSPNLRQKLTQFKMYLTDLPTRGIPRDDKLLADLTSLLGQ